MTLRWYSAKASIGTGKDIIVMEVVIQAESIDDAYDTLKDYFIRPDVRIWDVKFDSEEFIN